MAKGRIIKGDLSGLHRFVRGLSGRHIVRLGIFSGRAARDDTSARGGAVRNPELGALHEFGSFSLGIPSRSFLRMPLHERGDQIVERAGKGAEKLLAQGNRVRLLENLGAAAHEAVQDAFQTGGFGSWPKNSPMTVAMKGSSRPLIDTGQLRRSVLWKVSEPS